MDRFLWKLCLFVFSAVVCSGRTNELGVLAGAVAGAILSWPIYHRFVPQKRPEAGRKAPEQEPADELPP